MQKLSVIILGSMLIACAGQPKQEPQVLIEQPPKKFYEIAWFDNDWRICEVGINCLRPTRKSPIQTISLTAMSGNTTKPDIQSDSPRKIVLRFHFDEADSTDIGDLEALLTTLPETDRILIEGYTDSIGEEEYNKKLAGWRAEWVATWIRSRGIRNPLEIRARGGCCYLTDNQTEKGRAENRRVEVSVIKGKQ
ncbi:OmpA family protein [Nitrosomonas mobilis]|uniref:OmpA-like domain-containing protein n=1 Tax=Nitrosomonas mobilis TaxID=51642 RepID=A0A1G5SCU7_9PROT|nr:OmpA family protein [Nitrosomonas mobilis]SCZ85024.1 conserved exported hypothetical protein [Nitrosomonas mobilis]HNO76225.1 OmpA family protein [Nitrosomonas mobilis]